MPTPQRHYGKTDSRFPPLVGLFRRLSLELSPDIGESPGISYDVTIYHSYSVKCQLFFKNNLLEISKPFGKAFPIFCPVNIEEGACGQTPSPFGGVRHANSLSILLNYLYWRALCAK